MPQTYDNLQHERDKLAHIVESICDDIEKMGGVYTGVITPKPYLVHSMTGWPNLAQLYLDACKALGREPMHRKPGYGPGGQCYGPPNCGGSQGCICGQEDD